MKTQKSFRKVLGWREWVSLPDLAVERIKAKVDTGARTSALHATGLRFHKKKGRLFVEFKIHPLQGSNIPEAVCRAEVIEERVVKSSTGHATKRPVILVNVKVGAHVWPIELTLVNRDLMGFRMLLGREAVRGRFLVDPGRSFLSLGRRQGKPVEEEDEEA